MGRFKESQKYRHGMKEWSYKSEARGKYKNNNSEKIYLKVASILNKMDSYNISFKEAFAKSNCNEDIARSVYAIASRVLNSGNLCNNIIEESGILEDNPNEDKNNVKAIVSDFLWCSKEIIGQGSVFDAVRLKQDILIKLNEKHGGYGGKLPKAVFVRVNMLKYSVAEFIDQLQQSDYILIDTPSTYDNYLSSIDKLKSKRFMIDYHFKDLFVFSNKAKSFLWSLPISRDNSVMFQDKASLIPVKLLDASRGKTVLDMCAAPGMKTCLIAQQLQGNGQVIAVDRDTKRYQTMLEMIKLCGASKLVTAFNEDIIDFEVRTDEFDLVLLDAPCSGSGMRSRVGGTEYNHDRLRRLQWLQIKMLTKALTSFPNAKRIVYSTCSTNVEENEEVVQEVLQKIDGDISYQQVDCHKMINGFNRGSPDYECGQFCLRTDSKRDYTNDFFVAVFEKSENTNKSKTKMKNKLSKKKKDEQKDETNEPDDINEEINNIRKNNKTKISSNDLTQTTKPKKNTLKLENNLIITKKTDEYITNDNQEPSSELKIDNNLSVLKQSKNSKRNKKLQSSDHQSNTKRDLNGSHSGAESFQNEIIIENEIKKSKKRKRLNDSVNLNEINSDIVMVQNEKEKKHQNIGGLVDQNETNSDIELVQSEIHNKKDLKKQKNVDDSVDLTETNSDIKLVQSEIHIKTNLKKRKKQKNSGDSVDLNETNRDLDLAQSEIHIKKILKKRKKQKNSGDSVDLNETNSDLELVQSEIHNKTNLKKRKKQKTMDDSVDLNEINRDLDLAQSEIHIKKILKKRKKQKNVDDSVDLNETNSDLDLVQSEIHNKNDLKERKKTEEYK